MSNYSFKVLLKEKKEAVMIMKTTDSCLKKLLVSNLPLDVCCSFPLGLSRHQKYMWVFNPAPQLLLHTWAMAPNDTYFILYSAWVLKQLDKFRTCRLSFIKLLYSVIFRSIRKKGGKRDSLKRNLTSISSGDAHLGASASWGKIPIP